MPIDLSSYMQKEYEVDCDGQIIKLKPIKVWVLAPRGRKGVIIGLFKCPNGKTVRKAIGKTDQPVD